jgi:acyl transferase domain-containing protein
LKKWKVEPAAIVGHSSGEVAAAYACGSITSDEALLVAYHRGQVCRDLGLTNPGVMAAIGLGRQDVEKYLLPGTLIGCDNSANSVTLTGDADVVLRTMANIRKEHPDILVRRLAVECAYHSRKLPGLAVNIYLQ